MRSMSGFWNWIQSFWTCAQIPRVSFNSLRVEQRLGITNYVSRFVRNYVDLSSPLPDSPPRLPPPPATHKDVEFKRQEVHQTALDQLRCRYTSDKLGLGLITFIYHHKKTVLFVDTSPVGLGALTQSSKVIFYASKALFNIERCYSQFEREALAIAWDGNHLRMYLQGS